MLHTGFGGVTPGCGPTFGEVTPLRGRLVEAAGWSDLSDKTRSDNHWLGSLPRLILRRLHMSTATNTTETGATETLPFDDGAQASPLRRYCFDADRSVQATEYAEISVIARSEDEAWEKAQAQLDDGDVEWVDDEDEYDRGEPDLYLSSSEELTGEEIEEYQEEQGAEGDAVKAAEQSASVQRDCHSILASLRTTASEEERASLLDELERFIR
jgi:hypothetical protein